MAEKSEGELVKAFVYVIPLSRVYWGRRTTRAKRAVDLVRRFVKRHLKVDKVIITNEVNNFIWSRSREKPPRRIKVLVVVRRVKPEEEEEEKLVAKVKLAPAKAKPGPFEISQK